MEKSTKYVLIGVGVLALVGVGLYASAQMKKKKELEAMQSGGEELTTTSGSAIVDVASAAIDKIFGGQAAEQRLANRRVRTSTRQAKLLKKGKINITDLQALQKV